MENLSKSESKPLSKAVFLFIFARTLLFIPEQCLGIKIETMEYVGSFASVFLWVLLITYSCLLYCVFRILQEKTNEYFYIIISLILFDCISFVCLDNCLKLIITVLGLVFILNALRNKPLIKTEATVFVFAFISAFLIPSSMLSFVPLALMIYLFCNTDNHTLLKKLTLPISLLCSVSGIGLNRILIEKVPGFIELINRLGFSEIMHVNQSWKLSVVVLPTAIISFVFFDRFFKTQSKKNKKKPEVKSVISVDIVSVAFILSVCGLIFFNSEAFFTVNLIFPAALCVAVIKNDTITKETLSYFETKIAKNRFLIIVVIMVMFYICLDITDGYNSGTKIIDYIRY